MNRRSAAARDALFALAVAVLFAVYARTFVIAAFRVPSGSMAPTLVAGDHILVDRLGFGRAQPAEGGSVTVFRHPRDRRRLVVKRLAAGPGETVAVRSGRLLVGGRDIAPGKSFGTAFGPVTVPRRHHFVVGDSPADSADSRVWGPVPADAIVGRAFLVYWSSVPPARARGGWDRIGDVLSFFSRSRWRRCLTPVR